MRTSRWTLQYNSTRERDFGARPTSLGSSIRRGPTSGVNVNATVLRRTAGLIAFVAAACNSSGERAMRDSAITTTALRPALSAITSDNLLQHINRLASDGFEGRAPGTAGEDSSVAYITEQFKAIGLAPGNPDGTYIQPVSMIGYTSHPEATFAAGGKTMKLRFPNDYVAVSRRNATDVRVDSSDVVFVGYGVVAPEYGWDDYKGMDVKGKTIIMLINDPAVPNPNDSTKLDSTMFKGKAMTYYGRWTYKYEIASDKGAAAAIIVHETGPAGYPFDVVQGSWGRENFDVKETGATNRVAVESWMTLTKTKELFRNAGLDFDSLHKAATRKDFKPVSLNAKATFHVRNQVREIQSKNVVGKLEGSDPSLKNEYVVYTAHWDHLGKDTTLKGDQIFNGALDNASGVAALLTLAKAYKALPTPPARSLLFLAVTAEEQGLLGAKWYATHPLYPLDKTLADMNIDGVNQWGKTKDMTVVGYGNSTMDDLLGSVLGSQGGRSMKPDPEPEKGFYYRSDHFEFAKQGVPSLYVDAGTEYVGKDSSYGQKKRDEYTNNDYHKPSDQVKPDWDLSGAVEDLQAFFQVGYRVAQTDHWPEWKPGNEFKARRDSMLKGDVAR
jgi:Zn-dependent M28 family amino/carboxypeptidase